MYNPHRIQAIQLLCCFAVVLEMPAVWAGKKLTIHQMPLFRRFNQVHRLVASPQKSGEPNLRLFQPYLRRRQTSLSQPCSRLTGVVFQGALLLPRGFASDDGWRVIHSKSNVQSAADPSWTALLSLFDVRVWPTFVLNLQRFGGIGAKKKPGYVQSV